MGMMRKLLKRWQQDEVSLLAAAVSFYLAISLFPILLVLTAALGALFRWTVSGNDAREYILQVIRDHVAPTLATSVEASLAHIQEFAPISGPVGALMLLGSALLTFAQFERAFDRIWGINSQSITMVQSVISIAKGRLRAFVMLCGVAGLLVVVFVAGVVLNVLQRNLSILQAEWFWWCVKLTVALAINTFAFTVQFRFLPKVAVQWKHALLGGALAALVWEVGRQFIATFLVRQYSAGAYGVIGGFLAILVWGYYTVALIFMAASLVKLLEEWNPAPAAEDFGGAGCGDMTNDTLHVGTANTRLTNPRPSHIRPTATQPAGTNAGPGDTLLQPNSLRASVVASAGGKLAAIRHVVSAGGRLQGDGPQGWKILRPASIAFDVTFAIGLLYVGSFLAIRHIRSVPNGGSSYTTASSVQRVLFSQNPSRQRLAIRLYAPLIAAMPGPYDYRPGDFDLSTLGPPEPDPNNPSGSSGGSTTNNAPPS